MIKPGKMDKRVKVERPAELQAGSGELQTTFVPFTSRWAEISALQGREFFNAQQMTNAVTTRIRMRYFPELTEKMRILYTPNVKRSTVVNIYDIESIIHTDEDHRETIAMCVLTTSSGFKKDGARG